MDLLSFWHSDRKQIDVHSWVVFVVCGWIYASTKCLCGVLYVYASSKRLGLSLWLWGWRRDGVGASEVDTKYGHPFITIIIVIVIAIIIINVIIVVYYYHRWIRCWHNWHICIYVYGYPFKSYERIWLGK